MNLGQDAHVPGGVRHITNKVKNTGTGTCFTWFDLLANKNQRAQICARFGYLWRFRSVV